MSFSYRFLSPIAATLAKTLSPRDDLKSVLVRVASGLSVTKLLEALNETTEFENEMSKRMAMPVGCANLEIAFTRNHLSRT